MTYKLELTKDELRVVGAALGNMPYSQVARLIASIDTQVMMQDESSPSNKMSASNGLDQENQ